MRDEIEIAGIKSADDLEPFILYFTKLMGETSGKLMVALSLLNDLPQRADWNRQPEAVKLSVQLSSEILGDLFRKSVREAGGVPAIADADLDTLFRRNEVG